LSTFLFYCREWRDKRARNNGRQMGGAYHILKEARVDAETEGLGENGG
jgi:hypothetical protein